MTMKYYKELVRDKEGDFYVFYATSEKHNVAVGTGPVPYINPQIWLTRGLGEACTKEEYIQAKSETLERIRLMDLAPGEKGAFAGSTELEDTIDILNRKIRSQELNIENLEVDKVLQNKTIIQKLNDIQYLHRDNERLGKEKETAYSLVKKLNSIFSKLELEENESELLRQIHEEDLPF